MVQRLSTCRMAGQYHRAVTSSWEALILTLLKGLYTTTQAAQKLGVRPGTVRDAIARGALQVVRDPAIPHRNFITEAELERWDAARRQGTGKGWEKRKAPDFKPNPQTREYLQRSRERKRRASVMPSPPMSGDESTSDG